MAVKAIIMAYPTSSDSVADTWIVKRTQTEPIPTSNQTRVFFTLGLYKSKAAYNAGKSPVDNIEVIKMYIIDNTVVRATLLGKDDWYIPYIHDNPAFGETVSEFITGTVS